MTRRRLVQIGGAGAGVAVSGCLGFFEETEEEPTPTEEPPEEPTEEPTEEPPEEPTERLAYGICEICHHQCGQEVVVRDDGEQAVTYITGVDGNPRGSAGEGTEGTICPKGQTQIEKVHDPDRIKQPHIRENGELREVSWEEAFEYTAQRLQEFDAEYGAETFLNAASFTTTPVHNQFWRNLYGTPERIGRGIHVCAGPTFQAGGVMGVGSNNRIPDYQNSEYIIAWGRNMLETFAGQFEAKGVMTAFEENDATLVTIDPQHTETVQKSDKWLQIEPRTDGALALAMANVIIEEDLYDEEFVENWTYGFEAYREAVEDKTPEWAEEITGIDAEDIREVAIGFAEAAPNAGISIWTGTAQYGNAWKGTQNITALNGLVGNIDRPGGLRLWQTAPLGNPFEIREVGLPNNASGKTPALRKHEEYEDYAVRHTETIAHNLVPDMVENGHINGIYCHYDQPLKDGNAEAWIEALEEMDLVISVDAFWSGVAKRADIVLPEATQLEMDTVDNGGWSAYSNNSWIIGSKAAIEPQWNTKPGFDILAGIAEEMGWGEYFPWDSEREFINDQLSIHDLTLDELESGGDNYELVDEYDYEQWRNGDGTAFRFDLDQIGVLVDAFEETGMDTAPEWIPPGTYGDETSDEYPLEFFDTRAVFFSQGGDQHSEQMLERYALRHKLADEEYRGNYLVINPSDANERGIETGDMVRIESATGEGELMAYVSERTKPGFVTATYGFGEGSVQPDREGMNTMKLHEKQMDPISGQPDRHIAVDVAPGGD
ncbi:molybdopterin-dependent oxidoreductase [Halalkaliarchaeum sp. AArc-CO]|uniref:molybdopterin-containing oxidoreductase family protein n=1 Tax=Halalkaliarchaeum sp. AArc-CO TaxID=2866381 RepID=UPI00217EC321|nr:molybdopterin-dependent oxidoreductase [Halalkaliarchaeum sp. AArc-CO]